MVQESMGVIYNFQGSWEDEMYYLFFHLHILALRAAGSAREKQYEPCRPRESADHASLPPGYRNSGGHRSRLNLSQYYCLLGCVRKSCRTGSSVRRLEVGTVYAIIEGGSLTDALISD